MASHTSHSIHPPERRRRREWNYSNPAKRPFAVFEFIYRTRRQWTQTLSRLMVNWDHLHLVAIGRQANSHEQGVL